MNRNLPAGLGTGCACAVLVALACATVPSYAAPPSTPSDLSKSPSLDAVFGESIDVRVINVEAVVTDRRGNRVFGLDRDDFRLIVDGQEVEIAYFTEVRGGVAIDDAPSMTGGEPAPPAGEGRAVPTSYLVFVDDLLTLGRDRNRVLSALTDRLDQLRPGDRMAVVAHGYDGLEMLTSWTESKRELERALRRIEQRPARGLLRFAAYRAPVGPGVGAIGRSPLRLAGGDGGPSELDRSFRDPRERDRSPREEAWLVRTVEAAAASLRAFADPPGRKVMLLLAGGWHLGPALSYGEGAGYPSFDPHRRTRVFHPLIDTANLLGYTIYPVDVPGEVSTFGADVARRSSSNASPFASNRHLDDNLRLLADRTGGRPMLDGERFDALPATVADTASFYWLGFSPPRQRDGEEHRVEVEALKPRLEVRTRRSYRDLSPLAERTMMMESALLFGDLPADSRIELSTGSPVPAGRNTMTVPVEIEIPLSEVTALKTDGEWWIPLEVMLSVEDDRGRRSDVLPVPIELRRSEPPAPGQTAVYRTRLELRRRPHGLVVAVNDLLVGRSLFGRADLAPGHRGSHRPVGGEQP